MYERLRKNSFNNWVIIHLRYLLGLAFIPSGLVKLIGERFTIISKEHPIGYFFDALYQSGFYYNIIGFSQLFAALLLMSQRFSALAAIFYGFILANIWLITISLSFKGTWIITSLMMFAIIVLLVWDFEKLKPLFNLKESKNADQFPQSDVFWQMIGVIYFVLFLLMFLLSDISKVIVSIIPMFVVVIFFVSNWYFYKKRKKEF